MKTNKFGKLQKLIIAEVTKGGEKGSLLPVLHGLAFPGNSYPMSYIIPILLRMEHQQLLKVVWNRVDTRLSRVYLKGKHHGPKLIRGTENCVYACRSRSTGGSNKGTRLVSKSHRK